MEKALLLHGMDVNRIDVNDGQNESLIPSGSSVLIGLYDDDLDGDGGPQQVDHLFVGQRRHRHLADLHQPAALTQASFPRVSERLYVSHDALEVHVEAELAETVPAQGHFCGLAAAGHDLINTEKSASETNGTFTRTNHQHHMTPRKKRKVTWVWNNTTVGK